MTRGQLLFSIVGVIISLATLAAALMTDEQKKRFINWLKNLLTYRFKRFVTYPIYWINSRKCFYSTKVYWGESKQANERGYVYVMKKRNFLRDIRLKFARPSGTVDPRKLGSSKHWLFIVLTEEINQITWIVDF